MAPASAILLLVVSGEHSYKSQRATLSPAGASIKAALPPGLGGSVPFPRQLSSACTSTLVGSARAISGLDHHRDVSVAQDLLRVGHHDAAGPALADLHVGSGEQRVAADPLDDLGDDRTRLPRLDVRHKRDALHRQRRLGRLPPPPRAAPARRRAPPAPRRSRASGPPRAGARARAPASPARRRGPARAHTRRPPCCRSAAPEARPARRPNPPAGFRPGPPAGA